MRSIAVLVSLYSVSVKERMTKAVEVRLFRLGVEVERNEKGVVRPACGAVCCMGGDWVGSLGECVPLLYLCLGM